MEIVNSKCKCNFNITNRLTFPDHICYHLLLNPKSAAAEFDKVTETGAPQADAGDLGVIRDSGSTAPSRASSRGRRNNEATRTKPLE